MERNQDKVLLNPRKGLGILPFLVSLGFNPPRPFVSQIKKMSVRLAKEKTKLCGSVVEQVCNISTAPIQSPALQKLKRTVEELLLGLGHRE